MHCRRTHTFVSFMFLSAVLLTTEGCKLGYNKTAITPDSSIPAPICAESPSNPNADANAKGVFDLLASLTCGTTNISDDGYLMGQNTASGSEIANIANTNSYAMLVSPLTVQTSKTPAIVATDYELDRLYTAAELVKANDQLVQHWNKGGLVAISWTPLNPWVNDATDIVGKPGTANDTTYSETVNLSDLLDTSKPIYTIWHNKLAAIAVALNNLQNRDESVTVLFRPLPEMNSDKYWWGTQASVDAESLPDAELYKDLWQDMYTYLTEDKGLKNVLWVYSPAESHQDSDGNDISNTKVSWAYPGDSFVDIVAGIAQNDQLTIKDYKALVDFDKPLGMAEYGPNVGGILSAAGAFDNLTYADRLHGSYNYVSYWISGLSTDSANQALISNTNYKELAARPYIFSAESNKRATDL